MLSGCWVNVSSLSHPSAQSWEGARNWKGSCAERSPQGDLHPLPYFPLSPALTLKYKIKAATKTPKLCRKSPMTWIKAARTLGLPCSWLALWPCSGLWLCPWPDW